MVGDLKHVQGDISQVAVISFFLFFLKFFTQKQTSAMTTLHRGASNKNSRAHWYINNADHMIYLHRLIKNM